MSSQLAKLISLRRTCKEDPGCATQPNIMPHSGGRTEGSSGKLARIDQTLTACGPGREQARANTPI
jgi:hypothetical protein